MSDLPTRFSDRDVLFLIDTLMPERQDKERLLLLLRDDEQFIEAALDAAPLFERICVDQEILTRISPRLYFEVLLRRARKDLRAQMYTIERSHRQRIPVFDTNQVADFLDQPGVPGYLADMLASFTKVHSYTVRVRAQYGIWHRYRFSDMDLDGLIRYSQAVDPEQRFPLYKRIADVCLFYCGVFPEYVEAQNRYPWSGERRPNWTGRHRPTLEELREEGQEFYRLAAQHEAAQAAQLDEVLDKLAEGFLGAQKGLTHVASRYLQFAKQNLFSIG